MQFEHAAIQVEDAVAMARWYAEHLGVQVLRSSDTSPCAHFLADSGGRVFLEIYSNPSVSVPDYAKTEPLHLHFAYAVDDIESHRSRLIAAGAKADQDVEATPAGDEVTMLRDPWGLPLQLVRRKEPMC